LALARLARSLFADERRNTHIMPSWVQFDAPAEPPKVVQGGGGGTGIASSALDRERERQARRMVRALDNKKRRKRNRAASEQPRSTIKMHGTPGYSVHSARVSALLGESVRSPKSAGHTRDGVPHTVVVGVREAFVHAAAALHGGGGAPVGGDVQALAAAMYALLVRPVEIVICAERRAYGAGGTRIYLLGGARALAHFNVSDRWLGVEELRILSFLGAVARSVTRQAHVDVLRDTETLVLKQCLNDAFAAALDRVQLVRAFVASFLAGAPQHLFVPTQQVLLASLLALSGVARAAGYGEEIVQVAHDLRRARHAAGRLHSEAAAARARAYVRTNSVRLAAPPPSAAAAAVQQQALSPRKRKASPRRASAELKAL
jgi:hypothetical protein